MLLKMAASNGVVATVKLMLARGEDVNATDGSGKTPLMLAASNGHVDTCRLLLAAGASAWLVDDSGCTAADLAAKGNWGDVATLLTEQSKPVHHPSDCQSGQVLNCSPRQEPDMSYSPSSPAVIGCIGRFATPDSLANYVGLVPRQRSSAGKSRNGGITKAGSKRLRWALTEAVQSLCKADGPYRNLCKRLERKNKGKGLAATACARKLLTAIWCMLTRGETFRYAESTLSEDKAQRRERRLKAALPFVEEQKKRHDQVIQGQLALLQDLSSRRALMPIPPQLAESFGRLTATG